MKQFYLLALTLLLSSGLSAQVFVDTDATGAGDGTSWADAYTTIAAAVAAANDGDQIWVATGTYTHTETIIIDNSVAIIGGFNGTETTPEEADPDTNPVTLSGDVAGDDDPNNITTNRGDNIDILEIDSLIAPLGEGLPSVALFNLNFVGGQNAPTPDETPVDDFAGAAVLAYSTTAMSNIDIQACDSDNGAGVAFIGTGANGSIIDGITATGNTSASTGVVYINFIIDVVVNDGMFTQNVTNRGAVYAINALDILTSNCVFDDNTSTSPTAFAGGRGIGVSYLFVDNGQIVNCDFTNNTSSLGAGVYLVGSDADEPDANDTYIYGCNFIGNTAQDGFGGTMTSLSADYTVDNCVFENNTSGAGSGAAIYGQGNNRAIVVDSCVFRSNVGGNGALLVRDSATTAAITNTLFESNGDPLLTNIGAGLTIFGRSSAGSPVINRGVPDVTIDNSSFVANVVENTDFLGVGGAIIFFGDFVSGSLNITDTDFLGNTAGAGDGGAVCVIGGVTTTIDGGYFEGNTAGQGGAVRISNSWNTDDRQNPGEERDPADANINNSIFNQNTATGQGGAVIIFGSPADFTNNQFFGNFIAEDEIGVGGAIGLNGDSATILTFEVVNNTFAGNLSATEGDNISLFQDALAMEPTSTTANLTNNALFTIGDGPSVLVETSAAGEIVSNGGNFFNQEIDIAGMNDIEDEDATEEEEFIEAVEYTREEVNFTPFPTSALVDAGVTGPNVPATDINGAPRGDMPDIGSVEIASATVVDIITSSPDHTTLTAVLTAASLVAPLQAEGPFTVFAPTNDAFAAVDAAVLAAIQADVMNLLTPALLYHVVSDEFITSRNIVNGDIISATTMQGEDLSFDFDGTNITVTHAGGVATIVDADLVARNGIVQVIDQVMLPEAVLIQVGVEDIASSGLEISFFPNPVQEELHINATDVRIQDLGVSLINMNGQRLGQYQFGNGQHSIDVSQLPTGSYTLELTIGNEVYSTQILKK